MTKPQLRVLPTAAKNAVKIAADKLLSVNPSPADSKLPSAETLSALAASLGSGFTATEAVDRALELWRESCERIETEVKGQEARQAIERNYLAECGEMPASFPASLDDFLRLVVKAKTPADGMKKFRDYLRYFVRRPGNGEKEIDKDADKLMAQYQAKGFRFLHLWRARAADYLDYRKAIRSEQNKANARKKG